MNHKLEPVTTRVPQQLVITLSEEEIFGLRYFLGPVPSCDIKEQIKKFYPSLTNDEVNKCWDVQFTLFNILADTCDHLDNYNLKYKPI